MLFTMINTLEEICLLWSIYYISFLVPLLIYQRKVVHGAVVNKYTRKNLLLKLLCIY